MGKLVIEIIFFVILACIIIGLILQRQRHYNDKHSVPIVLALLVLFASFILIHLLFCYQLGFPASVTQNNDTDLTLTASDWLSFLGSYLGFAGSLVMAYLVYRQSSIINGLTIAEYSPSATLLIKKCIKSTDILNFQGDNILQPMPDESREKYYTIRYVHNNKINVKCETFEILIFIEIYNNSKSAIDKISFSSIEIKEIRPNGNSFIFSFCKDFDLADGLTEILPGKKLKRCIMFENIPSVIDTSWMNVKLFHGENLQTINTKVLIKKDAGDAISFLNISE